VTQLFGHKDLRYATSLIETVCWLAGTPDYLDDFKAQIVALDVFPGGRPGRSRRLYEWLVRVANLQGLSDQVAEGYLDAHGHPSWKNIAQGLPAACPKLENYWTFEGCGYRKSSGQCSMTRFVDSCPLPTHDVRNGNLSQLAYALFFFMRDVARGDLVGWIGQQIEQADKRDGPDRIAHMRDAVITPMRSIHGLSDKVLSMALSDFLIVGGQHDTRWADVGGSMIAIDTLVHNYLHRTGILKRSGASHLYGLGCYEPRGCAAIVATIAAEIDARQFNCDFPAFFPRYIQRAIWRFCAEAGLNSCNGRNIKDSERCQNIECRLFAGCDRIKLGSSKVAEVKTF
jgi:hypothetical protein